ncbi:MAG: hypothetical protein AAFX50_10040, partial [Acidobacteriota bacterium]
ARRGTFWIIGDGAMRFNPIHPRDVAEVMVERLLEGGPRECSPIGGPEVFDSAGLAAVCEDVLGRPVRRRHVPLGLARAATAALRPFEETWQLADFFVGNVVYARRELGDDASLPAAGRLRLVDYFRDRLLADEDGRGVASPRPSEAAAT